MSTQYEDQTLDKGIKKEEITKNYFPNVGLNRILPFLTFLVSAINVVVGVLSIVSLSFEAYPVPLLGILALLSALLFLDIYRQKDKWDFRLLILAVVSVAALLSLNSLPILWTGFQFNVFIDHSVFSAIFLLITGTPAMMVSLYYLLGATPSAEDVSIYPLILLPVVLILTVYLSLLVQMWIKGGANLDLEWITKPYLDFQWAVKSFIAGDWPTWTTVQTKQAGLLNYLQGTGLLMLLTSLISLPIGVGAGVFLNEYGDNRFGRTARFLISSLRAISLFVLGLTAFSIVFYTNNTPLARIFHGFWIDGYGIVQISSGGSYITASMVLSLLVIPIITSATEQGCHSLPQELREGSLALGASEDTTFWWIILPWSLPNIVTSVILGCAEAAGSVAVLLFIADRGQFGQVGLFKQVTSLAYYIFNVYYADPAFKQFMGGLQFTAGILLLMITFVLGILAMLSKKWLIHRYRGG